MLICELKNVILNLSPTHNFPFDFHFPHNSEKYAAAPLSSQPTELQIISRR